MVPWQLLQNWGHGLRPSLSCLLEGFWRDCGPHLTLLWFADVTDVASDVVVAASALTSDVTSKMSSGEETSVPVLME